MTPECVLQADGAIRRREDAGQPVPGQAEDRARPAGRCRVPLAAAHRLVADQSLRPGELRPDLREPARAGSRKGASRRRTSVPCSTTSRPSCPEIRHPETGGPLVERVYEREELYDGPHAHLAPDLTVVLGDWRYRTIGLYDFTTHKLISPAFGPTGDHRMEGMFIGAGPAFQNGSTLLAGRRPARHRADGPAPARRARAGRHGRSRADGGSRPVRRPAAGGLRRAPARTLRCWRRPDRVGRIYRRSGSR